MAPPLQHLLLLPLLLLPSLPLSAAETVLGVYIYHRHGDRTTKSYKPVVLTALGADEVHASGSYYRNQYVSANASSPVHGLSSDLAVLPQLSVSSAADAVLQGSASIFLQGLYPPAGNESVQTLADGTTVEPPLGGYQFIPVAATASAATLGVSESSAWLQGSSGCSNAVASSKEFYRSEEYLSALNSTEGFYHDLLPVINSTFDEDQASFKNAYTIFDYVYVSTIHNSTIPSSSLLTNETLHQLQTRADQHEWGLAYNASSPIRAVAGSVLAGQVLTALNATLVAPASNPRVNIQFGAYGTFMSFFGLAGAPAVSGDFRGVCDYASSMAFELVTNATVAGGAAAAVDPAEVSVRFRFANGTASEQNPARAYPLFGQQQEALPWKDFVAAMQAFAVQDTASWCDMCGNDSGACATNSSGGGSVGGKSAGGGGGGGGGVSRPVAGVIGAIVTLAVVLGIQTIAMALAGLRIVKKSSIPAAGVERGSVTSAEK